MNCYSRECLGLSGRAFAANMLPGIGFRGRQFGLAQICQGYDHQQDGHTQGGKDIQQGSLLEINQERNQQ